MKKLLLIVMLLLLVGCKNESKEFVKYKLNDNEKLEFKLTNDKVYKFIVDGKFYIYKNDKKFADFQLIYQDECTSIIASENIEMIEKKESGFTYKDENNYHYLYESNRDVCLLINSSSIDDVNEIISNSSIKVIEEK